MQDQLFTTRQPSFVLRFLIGMLLVPLGLVLRVLTQIYMEVTSAAVHYGTLMGIVTLGHLALIGLTVMTILNDQRMPLVKVTAIQLWGGYGIGAALLIIKDMG